MDDLVLKVKFSLKGKLKKHTPSHQVKKTDSIKIFNKTIPVQDVAVITLDNNTQKVLGCIVGEKITYRKPWAKIKKHLIQENIESEEIPDEYKPFIPCKTYIADYPEDDLLLVYAVDELREHDEFYLCLTLKEHEHVLQEIERMVIEQNFRINNAVNKRVRAWKSLGSEAEVDVNIPTTTRGLYKVELKSKYPARTKTQLRFEPAESKKFNYTDLTVSEKYMKAIVHKRRADAEVQTKPYCTSKEVQTTYNYPKHVWTQYEYSYAPVADVSQALLDGLEKKCGTLGGDMLVNSNVNFYVDDYEFLNGERTSGMGDLMSRKEYMSVINVKSNGKMVTAFAWHPLVSGTIAAAYGCKSPLVSVKCDATNGQVDAIFEEFWVLIWDINDTFHPKLMLECNSEVQCLSFCPHSENILVAGCVNGQILSWDLGNKLQLESEQKLTLKQTCYRNKIYALMQWSEQINNIPIIPIAAKSEMVKSHRGNVTGFNWIHPRYSISANGKCSLIPEDGPYSLGLMTSGGDGWLMFWDLRGAVYAQVDNPSKLVRNKTGVLRPVFTRRLIIPGHKFTCPLRWITQPALDVNFEETRLEADRGCFEVIKRKPVVGGMAVPLFKQELLAGTYLGDFLVGSWGKRGGDDQDDDDNAITTGEINVLEISRYHDGPVVSIEQHPHLPDVYLTVGGKVSAIWKIGQSRPVFWRRSRCYYTHGHWSMYQSSGFRLNRADGNREIWDLSVKSNHYHYQLEYTGKSLLQAAVHNFNIKDNLLALSEEQGSLRLVYIPEDIINSPDNTAKMKRILDNNSEIKIAMNKWQSDWIEKYASHLIEEEKRAELERARREKEAHKHRLRMKEKSAREAQLRAQIEEMKKHPPPGKRAEWAHEKWTEQEHKTLCEIMMDKKKLNRDGLREDRKPAQDARNEGIKLLIKKREMLTRSETIFKKTVSALFPAVSEDDRAGKKEDDDGGKDLPQKYIEAYEKMRIECETFIHEHPYLPRIKWDGALKNIGMKNKDLNCLKVRGRRLKFKREHDFKLKTPRTKL